MTAVFGGRVVNGYTVCLSCPSCGGPLEHTELCCGPQGSHPTVTP